ncbi:hypothetical protein DH2020_044591 [Rehmannia glutinosa]|uniref:Vacuolar fusion protein MON1 homolog n=1 Tax=Rehmannia glutinosa TaxID=99300 RepID=A0ABR0UH79_REHGL
MSSDSNSSSSSSSSDGDDRNPNSDPNPDPNPESIDQSLDALESQLASISMSSRSPTATIDDEEVAEEEEEQSVEQLTIGNGPLNEEIRAEEATDSVEDEHIGNNLKAEASVRNGPLNEEIRAEGAIESVEDEHIESNLRAEASGVIKERPSSLCRNISEVDEVERPLSPSSSGYAGERGSTSGGDEINDDDEDDNEIREVENDGVLESHAQWVSGKRHLDEDDASVSWRKRKKHFFILSHSGKPIYSRYGDEHKLAGFSATLQAIISFVENGYVICDRYSWLVLYCCFAARLLDILYLFNDTFAGRRVKLVRAGKHQVVFLVKGPIYLVCISCTEEPYESLKGQLELLYGQMILILTKSVNRCFEKNPKFDMTSLLGGTDFDGTYAYDLMKYWEILLSMPTHSLFDLESCRFSSCLLMSSLAYATRQAAGAILQDVAGSGVLFALLMCKHKVISLVGAQKASLHPDDILLLSNFIMSSESFRTSESFSPICLPRYNPMAFLYAYVHYFDIDTYLVLLTTSSDAFYHLKDSRIRIETVLLKSNVLSEVQRSLVDGGMHIGDLIIDPTSRAGAVSSHLGHQDLQQVPQGELRTDLLELVVQLDYGISYIGVFILTNMCHLNFHRQLTA